MHKGDDDDDDNKQQQQQQQLQGNRHKIRQQTLE